MGSARVAFAAFEARHLRRRSYFLQICGMRETVVAAFKCGARGVLNLAEFELRELGSYLEKVRAGKVWADSTEVGWITEALME